MREKTTLACFISGPFRYCDLVLEQLQLEVNDHDYTIHCYIHLWSEELGLKSRNISLDISKLEGFGFVKKIIVEKPFIEGDTIEMIENEIGYFSYEEPYFIGASSINNMFGMFHAINRLYEEALSSDYKYSHILRLRTDISFSGKFIPKKIDNKLYISENIHIESGLISDHTMLMPINFFEKIWGNKQEFIREFSGSFYNPEILLKNRISGLDIKIENKWTRYQSYFIVHERGRRDYILDIIDTYGSELYRVKISASDKIKIFRYLYKIKILKSIKLKLSPLYDLLIGIKVKLKRKN
ncbi:hypothetical protein AB4454_05195 [Vibrio artabrorum]|uniref:hypothetical protein n=1 Tax=Vibrio artabrorum TaxID=446374 RepID=UPI00354D781F